LLSGPSTAALLWELADVVIVDSAPVLPITDGVVLSRVVDGVIIVVSAATADRRQVARTVQRLASKVADADASPDPDEQRSPVGITTADLFDARPAAGVPRGSGRLPPDH